MGAAIPAEIFRAYDIRGVVGEALNPAGVAAIGQALGTLYSTQRPVCMGRDGRLSSPDLARALGEGLTAAGCTVLDLGEVPTPLLYYATHALGTGAGVMVTGSHNPAQYNGLKVVMGGQTLYGEAIQGIRRRLLQGGLRKGRGHCEPTRVGGRYVDEIRRHVELARPLRVALDCGNGVAGPTARRLFRALGCDPLELYCEVDGRFPNHHPNPSDPQNLAALARCVRDQGLDLGLAFDGDGDRLVAIDERGRVIWPDRLMMVYAADVLSRHSGASIVYDVKCSRHLGEVIARAGGRPIMWKTGHSLLKAKMQATGALLAGELSGHIFFRERWHGFDDGLYAGARLLEILSRDPRPPSAVFAELPDAVSTPELYVDLPHEGAQHSFMDRFLVQAHFPGAKLTRIDGLRVDFPEGWGLVRASHTTPSLVVRLEADTAQGLTALKRRFKQQIHRIAPGLALPF